MLASIPTSIGRGGALVKRISEGQRESKFLGAAVCYLVVAIVGATILIWPLQTHLNVYFEAEIALWMIPALGALHLRNLVLSTLKGELRVAEIPLLTVTQKLLWVGLGAILVWMGGESQALIISYVVGLLAAFALGVWKVSTPVSVPTRDEVQSLFNYWKWSSISFVDGFLYNWTDVVLIGFFVTQAAVGAYEVAWRVAGFAILFTQSLETAILPQISSLSEAEEYESIRNEVQSAVVLSLWLVIPIAAGSLFVGEQLLSTLFGEEYGPAGLALSILLGGKIIEGIDSIYKNLLSGLNRPDLRMKAAISSGVFNVIFNLILINEFGIVGAAIATTAAFVVSTVLILWFTHQLITIRFPWVRVGTVFAATLCMVIVTAVVQMIFVQANTISLITTIAISAMVYVICCLTFPPTRTALIDITDKFEVIR